MSVEIILIVLSSLVILSYLFDMIAKQFKFPSVIFLMGSGIGLHYLSRFLGIEINGFTQILPVIGTIGLILIVLEGALELKLEKSKAPLIKRAFHSSLFILLLTTGVIAGFLNWMTGSSYHQCFLNAVPFGIISSAIAIPTASVLSSERKNFIIYESSFSDIFGIILFNFMISNNSITASSFINLIGQSVTILILAGAFCLGLLYLMKRIKHHLKFFLIIAVLVLVYGIGKLYHLPTLVIVLAFGLFLNNIHWIKLPWFEKHFTYENFSKDFNQLTQLSGETAFIVRTFFFLIFGFTLNVESLMHLDVLIWGIIIVILIYSIRVFYQKILIPEISWAEIFLSPRGLISILLFFSIPVSKKLEGVTDGLLFFVILATSVVMAMGLLSVRQEKTETRQQTI
jgi:Kef-type K+ transport system membrane component KefB